MMQTIYNFSEKYFKYILLINIILLFLIGIIPIKSLIHKDTVINPVEDDLKLKIDESVPLATIKVDIKGEINNPGLYEIKENSTLNDVIKQAGDFTAEANSKNLNLSAYVVDEALINIPALKKTVTKTNNSNNTSSTPSTIKKEVIIPSPSNKVTIKENNTLNIDQENIININTASVDELITLNGIGESKAQAIIEYRNSIGLFKNINEIKNVKGIGEAVYEKIKDFISV